MAQSQCRPCEPRPVEGDVGDRELPHGGARRACRALRVLARGSPTTPAATVTARSAKARPPRSGSPSATELLPVPYYHVVFTLPAPISDIAYQNKAVIYDILFKASAETDHHRGRSKAPRRRRRHLRAAQLGLGDDASPARAHDRAGRRHLARRGAGCRAGPASSCRCACSRACSAGCSWRSSSLHTNSFNSSAITLRSPRHRRSRPIWRRCAEPNGWSTQSVRSAGPGSARLSVALYSSCRNLQPPADRLDDAGVTFKWKDYRAKGRERAKVMTLATGEFIRRFLIHVLPAASTASATTVCSPAASAPTTSREHANCSPSRKPQRQNAATNAADSNEPQTLSHPCPCCGGRMIVIEIFQRGCSPRTRPTSVIRIDTS